jgi:integrase
VGTGGNRKFFRVKNPGEIGKPGEAGEAQVEALKREFLYGPAPCRPGSVNEFFDKFWQPQLKLEVESGEKSPETYRCYLLIYKNDIMPVFGNALLKEITPLHLQAWVNHLRANTKEAKTVHNKYGVLSTLLKNAWRLQLIDQNFEGRVVLPKITRRKPRRELNLEMGQLILESVKGTQYHGPVWAMMFLALRRNEAMGLRPIDIELRDNCAIVNIVMNRQRRFHGPRLKNKDEGESRWLAIPREWGEFLLRHQRHHSKTEPLFRNDNLSEIKPETFTETVHRRFKKFGIPIQVKNLRNWGLSNLRATGTHEFVIRDVAGHEDIETTMIYQDKQAADFLSAFSRLKSAYDTAKEKNDTDS